MTTSNSTVSINTIAVRWLRPAHVLWCPAAAVALGIFIASLPGYMVILQEGGPGFDLVANPSSLKIALNIAYVVISISAALLSLTLAWVLYRKKSGQRMMVFLSFFLLLYGVGVGPLETLAHMWLEYPLFGSPIFASLLYAPPFIAIMFLFPDGRFVPSWTRWLLILSIPIILVGYAVEALIEKLFASPLGMIGSFWSFAVGLTALFAQIYRYRVVSGPVERQQTKWVIYGLVLWFLFIAVSNVAYPKIKLLPPGSLLPWWASIGALIFSVSLSILPVSLTIAVMRYRLYDIDILINRTLVYGVLTASTMGIYVFAVGYLGNLLQAQDKSIIAFLTTGLVALFFQPFRERLQRVVNRMMYGERDDPMSVLLKLGKQLEGAAYRIVQEALTNVVQHSQARVCVVQLALDGELSVKVSDDGIGIGENQKTGIGLHSMRERAEELGGRCVIEPAPEGGILVWVRLPIPKE